MSQNVSSKKPKLDKKLFLIVYVPQDQVDPGGPPLPSDLRGPEVKRERRIVNNRTVKYIQKINIFALFNHFLFQI